MMQHNMESIILYKDKEARNFPTGNVFPIPVCKDTQRKIYNPQTQQGKFGSLFVQDLVNGISPASMRLFSLGLTTGHWLGRLSGIKSFSSYCSTINTSFNLPLSVYTISDYLAYLSDERNVSRDTAICYTSHLKVLHESLSFPSKQFEDYRIKTIINGIGNDCQIAKKPLAHRRVITFNVLKVLGHIIANLHLPEFEYTTIWCIALFLFWGSFRGSEILAQGGAPHQIAMGLKWRNVQC